MCLKKHTFFQISKILNETHCDYSFVKKHFAYKCDVLRFSNKGDIPEPKLVEIIRSRYRSGEHSFAHALFLKKKFGIPVNKKYKYDKFTKVFIHYYKTKCD